MYRKRLCLTLVALALAAGADRGATTNPEYPPAPSAADRATEMATAARLRQESRWLDALAIYERLREVWPRDRDIHRLRTLTLADLGAAHQAWTLYRARPELFSPGERRRLEADRVARLVVWGGLYPASEVTRLDEMQFARRELETYLATLTPEQQATANRLRADRIEALNGLEQHPAAVAAYREMVDDGVPVPPYALTEAADSLLAERHQRDAIDVLGQVLEQQPTDFGSEMLLAYAQLEIENHMRANERLEDLAARNDPWPRLEGAPRAYQNWQRFDADHHGSMMLSYGDRLEESQQRLESLVAIGPANAQLQARLGEIYLRRGWSERALERQRMARTLQPRNVRARIEETYALLDLHRVDAARPVLDELTEEFSGNVHVQRLEEHWNRFTGWRWTALAAWSESDAEAAAASASPLGARDFEYGLHGETPLFHDRWRLTAHAVDRYADFTGVRVHHTRAGLGLLYEYDRTQFALEASQPSDSFSDEVSAGARLARRFHDTVEGRLRLYHADPRASLQARRFGITADSAELGVDWTPSDLGRLGLTAQHLRYDDDNEREAVLLAGERRLLTRPHLQLIGVAETYASQGSREDAPYFNPTRDGSWSVGLRGDHLAWRRYERHFRHRLSLYGGQYWQEGYGTFWVPKIEYRHEWGFGLGRILDYGIAWSRPVYDGEREERFGFDIGFRWGVW